MGLYVMRRSRLERICTALLAAWFAFLMVEPIPLHVCAMHDGPTPGATAVAHQHQELQAGTPHDASDHDSDRPGCSCLGDCCGASPTAVPVRVADHHSATVAAARQTLPPGPAYTPVAPDFVLPFANGPPIQV